MTDDLIRADNTIILGDKGYVSEECKRATQARGAVKDKRKLVPVLLAAQKWRNKNMVLYGPGSSTFSG